MANITSHAPLLGSFAFGGSNGVVIFVGNGDPNLAATDSPQGDLAASSVASLFLRVDGPDSTHCHYVKTGAATVAAPTGVWTAK
jgi:hypothetical protein